MAGLEWVYKDYRSGRLQSCLQIVDKDDSDKHFSLLLYEIKNLQQNFD